MGQNSGPIFRRLWTRVHQNLYMYGSDRSLNAICQLTITCCVLEIAAITSQSCQKSHRINPLSACSFTSSVASRRRWVPICCGGRGEAPSCVTWLRTLAVDWPEVEEEWQMGSEMRRGCVELSSSVGRRSVSPASDEELRIRRVPYDWPSTSTFTYAHVQW